MCCIGGIGGLASQKTARLGNILGMTGVACGVAATLGTLNAPVNVLAGIGALAATGGLVGYKVGSHT
eukprot:35620-Eustigmatos_ZCMA.PRE.1